MIRRSTTLRSLYALLLTWLLLACGREDQPTRAAWPEGTVLVVGGVEPIQEREVDRWLEAVALAEPGRSRPGLRRLSLTNVVLPQHVARAIEPEGVERSRRQAEAAREALAQGQTLPGAAPPIELVEEGHWKALGLDVWQLARHAPLGEWQVHESVGGHFVFRVLSRDPEPWHSMSQARLERMIFPYLDEAAARQLIDEAMESMPLEILDERWREIVPARHQARMGVAPVYEREVPATPQRP